MSFTLNGIGTRVHGCDRELTRRDQCDQCGALTNLRSYDATKYFVFFFIPIIPLGKLRLLDHCPHCQRWRQMPLKEWEKTKEQEIRKSLEAIKKDPNDPEAVKQAMVTATQFQDEGTLLKFRQLADNFRSNAELQNFLGATLSYFGRNEEAIVAYQASLAAEDDPEVREQLGIEYIHSHNLPKAEQCLQHTWTDPEKVGFGLALAQGYQAIGDHASALARLDKLEKHHPQLANDPGFIATRKEANKLAKKGAPVSGTLGTTTYKEQGSGPDLARWIFPILAGCGLLAFVYFSISAARNREVVVLNGLSTPYTTTLNGEAHELRPGVNRIKMPEGEVIISGNINGVPIDDTVRIRTSFWSRLFSKSLFVINPDQTAIIENEEILYADSNRLDDLPAGDYEVLTGKNFYQFAGIEYPFQPPKPEVELPSESSVVHHERVGMAKIAHLSEMEIAQQLVNLLDEAQLKSYLIQRAKLGTQSDMILGMLFGSTTEEELMPILRPMLEIQPINVAAHRMYQEIARDDHEGLIREYRDRLAADPANTDLMYLVARIMRDKKQKYAMLKKSTEGDSPSAYGHHSIGFLAGATGRPEQGISHSEKAVEMHPDNQMFVQQRSELLEAMGKYDALMADLPSSSNPDLLLRLQAIAQRIPIMVAGGKGNEVETEVNAFLRLNSSQIPPAALSAISTTLRAALAYAKGDAEALTQLAKQANGTGPVFMFVEAGELGVASKLVEESGPDNAGDDNLMMYIACQLAGEEALAKRHLERAMEALAEGDWESKLASEALRPGADPNHAQLRGLEQRPQSKRILMAALALRYPDESTNYKELAQKLNFSRKSPHLLVARAVQ